MEKMDDYPGWTLLRHGLKGKVCARGSQGVGVLLSPDYVFSVNNFAGINLSMVGALYYSWLKFSKKNQQQNLKVLHT